MMDELPSSGLDEVMGLARQIDRLGQEAGLPYIAVSADISDPSPMTGDDGRPLAESVFRWLKPGFVYWKDRSFALRPGLLSVVRICGEPFYYSGGRMAGWRNIRALDDVNRQLDPAAYASHGIAGAITCPVHSPMGTIGAVVWATGDAGTDIARIFSASAERMHILALKFVSAYRDARQSAAPVDPVEFTRREMQCLKWAAAGKTDNEIATIMGVSVPTIRFHLTNASRKLGVSGRAQVIRIATNMGYIGPG